MLVDETPVPRKVARLHLLCDILHNSAVSLPSAWKYRQEFQARLGLLFDHLSTIYHSFPGRITADTFKSQITAVVDVWEDAIVFPPDFTAELRQRLDGVAVQKESEEAPQEIPEQAPVVEKTTSKFKTNTFKSAVEPEGGEDMEIDDGSDGEANRASADDLDGAPLDDDVDGIPMDDDLDGAPMDDDVDGAPMDDDLDGEPL
jgi:U2-associated protein SR140